MWWPYIHTYIHTVDPMLLPSGNPFKCHEEVLYLQPMIPPKRFDIFPPDWGMLRGLGASACSSPYSGWIWCSLTRFFPIFSRRRSFIYFKSRKKSWLQDKHLCLKLLLLNENFVAFADLVLPHPRGPPRQSFTDLGSDALPNLPVFVGYEHKHSTTTSLVEVVKSSFALGQ